MPATMLGSLLVSLGLESGAFKSGLDTSTKQFRQAQKQFEKIGASMADVGKKMTLGITLPMAAMAGQAIAGAKDQAKAMAQVEAALTSMGAVSGKTADELAKTADAMEMKSLFDADVILTKITANLLTFGNVAGDVFDRAQQSAIDMAQRMGSDPQSAAIMLGKALNSPIQGITALTRVGVQFTAAQKAQIEAFTKTGQVAKAQGIILSEVERQFAGAAEAAANEEPWRKAEVVWNQAMDKIGEALLPIIPVIGDAIAKIADTFSNLSPEAQKFIIVAAGIAAALGPVIFIVGQIVSLAAPLAAALTTAGAAAGGASTGFAALAVAAAPWIAAGAAIGAVGYLIYQNWDKIAPVLESVWEAISSTLGPPLTAILNTVTAMFTELWNGPLGDLARGAINILGQIAAAFLKAFGGQILSMLKTAFTLIAAGLETLLEVGRMIGSLFRGDVSGAFEHLGRAINTLFGGLPAKVIGWMAQLVTGVRGWLVDRLNAVWDWVIGKVKAVGQAFYNLYDAVVGHSYIPDMVDGIAAHMRRLDAEMVKPVKDAANKAEAAFRALQERMAAIMADLFPEVRDQIDFQNRLNDINAHFDALKTKAEKAKKSVEELAQIERQRAAFLDAANRKFAGLDRDRLAVAPGAESPDIEAQGKSLEEISADISDRMGEAFGKVGQQAAVMKVQVIESVAQMVEGALSELDRFVRGVKSGNFFDIIGGIFGALDKFGSIFTGGKGFNLFGMSFGKLSGALAEGGPAMAGRSYLVGEEGPEIFTPHISGSVIPNDGIGRGGSIAQIVPSPYFDVVVNGHVMRAGPGIAEAGAARAHEQNAFASNWKLA